MAFGSKSELGIRVPQFSRASYSELAVVRGQKPLDTIAAHLTQVASSYNGDPTEPFIASLSRRDLQAFENTSYECGKVNGFVQVDKIIHQGGRRNAEPSLTLTGHGEVDLPVLSGREITCRTDATNSGGDLYVAQPKFKVAGIPDIVSRGLVSAALTVASPCVDTNKLPSQSLSERTEGVAVRNILLTSDSEETLLFVMKKTAKPTGR